MASHRAAYAFALVRAILALTFSLAVLIAGTGLSRLMTFIALYALGAGVVTLRWVLANRSERDWGLALLAVPAWIAVAVALLLRGSLESAIGEDTLLDAFGIVAIGFGVLRMSGRFHDDPFAGVGPRARYRYVAGPLDVVLGIVVLIADTYTSTGIRITLGVWGLVTGTSLLLDVRTLRRAERSGVTAES